MRAIIALAFLTFVAALSPALAQKGGGDERAATRAELLAQLRAAESEAEAAPIVDAIWRLWRTGPDVVATGLLLDVQAHLRAADTEAALAILDQIVTDYPDWAEGWNARATFYYFVGRNEESLADIERTLALEPAHFGALAGRGLIHLEAGRAEEAREAFLAAMEIHPWLPERRLLQSLPPASKR